MSTRWKNRILYWVLVAVPLGGVLLVGRLYGSIFFFFFLLFYVFIYRPLLDTQRLMSLGCIEEKDAWRFFVPFAVDYHRYIRALWLG